MIEDTLRTAGSQLPSGRVKVPLLLLVVSRISVPVDLRPRFCLLLVVWEGSGVSLAKAALAERLVDFGLVEFLVGLGCGGPPSFLW